MERRSVNAANAPQPFGYAQVCEVRDVTRWAFVSGQIPQSADGVVPETFEAQCRQVWTNVETQLKAVDMGLRNIVKVTMFLAGPEIQSRKPRRAEGCSRQPRAGA